VQVGRVFGQEEQLGADGTDGAAQGFAAVTAEVVHDHDVAAAQCRQQHLLDVEAEALTVDWTIDQPGSLEAGGGQCGAKREGLPPSMRHLSLQVPRPACSNWPSSLATSPKPAKSWAIRAIAFTASRSSTRKAANSPSRTSPAGSPCSRTAPPP